MQIGKMLACGLLLLKLWKSWQNFCCSQHVSIFVCFNHHPNAIFHPWNRCVGESKDVVKEGKKKTVKKEWGKKNRRLTNRSKYAHLFLPCLVVVAVVCNFQPCVVALSCNVLSTDVDFANVLFCFFSSSRRPHLAFAKFYEKL